VTDNAATEQVLFGPDGVASSKRVKCVVDFSTSGPPTAGEIGRRLNEKGIAFVDAPVTGGTPRAANGTLTIIAAGDAKAIEMAQPAFAVLGSNVFVAGAQPGQAQIVKLVNNMLNYLAMAATAEAMVVGVKAGLDPQLMLDVLNTGTGKNSATEVKFPKAVLTRSFNYGATNHTVDKDLLLFLDEAERMKLPSPIARNLSDLWHGWAKEHPVDDITTITKMYEHWAGVEVRGKAK
jgi:3-hydroxyisobutyrate dehydrogenase-like beta-hydroxyacid dehydrogenase